MICKRVHEREIQGEKAVCRIGFGRHDCDCESESAHEYLCQVQVKIGGSPWLEFERGIVAIQNDSITSETRVIRNPVSLSRPGCLKIICEWWCCRITASNNKQKHQSYRCEKINE